MFFRAGYLYIYELDTNLFPFFTMCVIDADTTVNCSDPYSLTIEMRRGDPAKDTRKDPAKEIRKDFLIIFVDILGEALRAEHLILSSNNCKVIPRKIIQHFFTHTFQNNEVEIGNSDRCYRVGICNDRLVWETVNKEKNIDEEQETTGGNYGEKTFIVKYRNLLHAAVDRHQLELMLAWAPGGEGKAYQECPGTGGSGIFSSLENLLQFLQTIRSCSDVKVIHLSSRKKSVLP